MARRTLRRSDFSRRTSGLLLHLTSLPGPHGSGDLGREAYRFLDFCHEAGQSWWQMLPIGPPGPAPGFSPYSSPSSVAGNPFLIALDPLVEAGLLDRRDVQPPRPFPVGRVDHARVHAFRERALRRAAEAFRHAARREVAGFERFCQQEADWLEEEALFAALQRATGRPWPEWAPGLRDREPAALKEAREAHAEEIRFQKWVQFIFDRQWRAFRAAAASRGVGLMGDLPIFVPLDSVDAWLHRELFLLDRRGRPRFVTGCPPDIFSDTGQRWNHPQYDWPAHERSGFVWWRKRFAALFRRFDAIRIDHFLGFRRVWSVPARSATAERGRWLPAPGEALLSAMREELGDPAIVAEDLGLLTPQAAALRDGFGLPGMRVMQFGFGPGGDNGYHRPHSYPPHCVAYTGTHDNDTMAGWFRAQPPEARRALLAYVGGDAGDIAWSCIRTLMASPANTVIFPLQDVLNLGSAARMNTPGTERGNWHWRAASNATDAALARRLSQLVEVSERSPR